MLLVMKHYFEHSLKVKKQDGRGDDNFGYEGMGTEECPKPKTRDGRESLKISRPAFLKGSAFNVFKSPSTLDANGQFLTGMTAENERFVERDSKVVKDQGSPEDQIKARISG
ncbi:uncharacterized protein EAE97_000269 [Botrytis byssoidea]|uniref:Uncharacterized protein n=1 Tax=Botrytis byssoidea TaxID=139641 RepID=A0A9P5IZZ9_9HELO|nr:uncharacterized protein EAE97_000269 [Botrytis byssoidea]KAF7955010.1 hypothetical protein EAE97_000269 [Botrytis byssoidea]